MKQYWWPLLCLVGLLLALATAAKPPTAMGGWPDTLPYTLGGYALALVGVVLWRRQPHPLWAETALDDPEAGPLPGDGGPLTACVVALQSLRATSSGLTMPLLLTELEAIHTQWVLPLSRTHRPFMMGVSRERGMERLAFFAQGELWLNRARSAAGDQHRGETERSMTLALEQFLVVQQSFQTS